jgi:hypothetical protein
MREPGEPALAPGLAFLPLESAYYGEDIGVGTAGMGFWIFGGFAYQWLNPRSSQFESAETLSLSVVSLFPNPKAPFALTFDVDLGRYRLASGGPEEYETASIMVSMSTWIDEDLPLYLGAGIGAVRYELPSDPDAVSGAGLARKVLTGYMFPVGRFDMAIEFQKFWGNAEGTILDAEAVAVRVMCRF